MWVIGCATVLEPAIETKREANCRRWQTRRWGSFLSSAFFVPTSSRQTSDGAPVIHTAPRGTLTSNVYHAGLGTLIDLFFYMTTFKISILKNIEHQINYKMGCYFLFMFIFWNLTSYINVFIYIYFIYHYITHNTLLNSTWSTSFFLFFCMDVIVIFATSGNKIKHLLS